MNDFSEIENELKKLRPIEPSRELITRVQAELGARRSETAATDVSAKIVTPARFRINWLSVGATLAAAALLLLFARAHFENRPAPSKVVSHPPSPSYSTTTSEPATERSTITPARFVPAGATQVVYRTEDEGLLFPTGSEQPVRRVRARMRETLQWQNPQTGASLRVSYPAEEVTLLPVYGH